MPSFMKVIYDLANLPCKRFLVPHGHDFIDLLGTTPFVVHHHVWIRFELIELRSCNLILKEN